VPVGDAMPVGGGLPYNLLFAFRPVLGAWGMVRLFESCHPCRWAATTFTPAARRANTAMASSTLSRSCRNSANIFDKSMT
jgi:hypothetical protein